ncbi:MAG: hypothetical protein A2133_01750 [Actinobacteria bacterium RBG_16_64_13]|nr:MAG: hypothetical protein A2133_01750 [Actinobacteria bacterium RBG_16_64_13]
MRVPLAIVGNGGAAAEAVVALRAHAYAGDIHLFADNQDAPYNPMLGTYLISGAIPLERAFPFGDGHRFYEDHGVTTHLGQAVTALDAAEQRLTTGDGSAYSYDYCLVATGARPAVPPVLGLREALAAPGGAQERRVFTLRSFSDAAGLKETLACLRSRPGEPARVAVVGASFVGIKVASLVHDLGMRVCLIEREPHILPLSAHPDCARPMEDHLLEQGYELRLGAALAGVEMGPFGVRLDFGALPGAADPSGAKGTACEESTTQEDVDLVVVCAGIRTSLDLLAAGQVDTAEGILVDERMRSSIPTLYAAGDVAQGKNLLSGRHEIIGSWASARYQGRAAGRSLAGAPAGYPGGVPHNITHVGRLLFASVGCIKDYDRMTICRDGNSLQVRVWQGERLAGVNLLDCCLNAGTMKQALLRAATGAVTNTGATWISFNG